MPDCNAGRALYAVHQGTYVLKLVGDVRASMCLTLDNFIERIFADESLQAVLVDLSETTLIDSTALGLVSKIAVSFRKISQDKPVIISTHADVTRILDSMGLEQVFEIVEDISLVSGDLKEVAVEKCVSGAACERVLEAHRILMSLNKKNHEIFKDVVKALEEGSSSSELNCCEDDVGVSSSPKNKDAG